MLKNFIKITVMSKSKFVAKTLRYISDAFSHIDLTQLKRKKKHKHKSIVGHPLLQQKTTNK